MNMTAHPSSIYSPDDLAAIQKQIRNRWLAVAIPCVLLLVVLIVSLVIRVEAITTISTILIGAILIFCWDVLLKPLYCYKKHLNSVLYGRVHEVQLPFVALSEDINMVDGVPCRLLTCQDLDAKGRTYDRLFYLDAHKSCPAFEEGTVLAIVHHDLLVADVTRA